MAQLFDDIRSFRPTRREAHRDFDPLTEGARYGLSPEVAQQISDRACREATDRHGWINEEEARRRFHEVADRAQRRGGLLGTAPGKMTRTAALAAGARFARDAFLRVAPGKRTRFEAEIRRWARWQGGANPEGRGKKPGRPELRELRERPSWAGAPIDLEAPPRIDLGQERAACSGVVTLARNTPAPESP